MLRYLSRNQKHVTKKFIDIVIRDPGGLAFQKKVKILLRCPFKLLDAEIRWSLWSHQKTVCWRIKEKVPNSGWNVFQLVRIWKWYLKQTGKYLWSVLKLFVYSRNAYVNQEKPFSDQRIFVRQIGFATYSYVLVYMYYNAYMIIMNLCGTFWPPLGRAGA